MWDLVKEVIGDKAIVMNVIDPTISLLREKYLNKNIGLIGTRQTVNSNVYKKKMEDSGNGVQLTSLATNLLAAAIEEFGNSKAIDGLLEEYLSHPTLKNLDALILACTHYPIIKQKIAQYFNHNMEIIDPSETVAKAVETQLKAEGLLNLDGPSQKIFYVSDYTETFAAGTKLFFDDQIKLQHYPLWS